MIECYAVVKKKELDLYTDMEQALRNSGNNKVHIYVCISRFLSLLKKIYKNIYIYVCVIYANVCNSC